MSRALILVLVLALAGALTDENHAGIGVAGAEHDVCASFCKGALGADERFSFEDLELGLHSADSIARPTATKAA